MSVSKLKKISVIFLTLIITALMMCSVSAEDGTSCSANCNGTYKNGFCSTGNMSHVEPATQNQHGVYQIENGGQLFWFASQVNSGKSSLNAELTCDIDLEGINWTPIGKSTSAFYTGEFNGNGYVISNLCIDTTNIDNAGNIGLFGYVKGGIINDFTVQGEISVKSGEGIGGAVGYANYYKRSAVISNIISKVNISGVENCKSVGGVVGGLFDANDNVDYVYNCVNYGNISLGTSYDGIGGIVGYAYAGDSIVNCVNYGNMSAAGISDITPCMGGILGYQRHTMVNFKGNLNLGIITDTSGQNSRTGAIAGWFRNNGSNATVSSDNYALEGTAQFLQGMHNEMKELTASFVTMEQLSNGEVAYWLSQSNVENQPSWGQNIGTDQYPQLGGKKVYRGYDKCKAIYSNSNNMNTVPSHTHEAYENGFCTYCGACQPARYRSNIGGYVIENAGNLFWFAGLVNGTLTDTQRNSSATAYLIADVDLENREWQPIGTAEHAFQGSFIADSTEDFRITGLNVSVRKKCGGLFGYVYNGKISGVTVEGKINIIADNLLYVGGIVGCAERSTIEKCNSYVDITCMNFVTYFQHFGGIAGSAQAGSKITECSYYGDCNWGNSVVECLGGITGYANENVYIGNCGFYGSIVSTKGKWVGGILGYVNNTAFQGVKSCLSIGTVQGMEHVGAVIGWGRNYTSNTIMGNYYLFHENGLAGFGRNDQPNKTVYVSSTSSSDLKNGNVTRWLNNYSSSEYEQWGQDLEKDQYPIIGGKPVYRITLDCQGNTSYNSNINADSSGHLLIHYEGKAETCTEDGWRDYSKCTLCEHTTYQKAPALGHSFDSWQVVQAPTCTQVGSQERVCFACYDKETRSVDALGHAYDMEWTIDVEPTCTTVGSKSHHCSRCNDKVDITEIPANGHTWGDWYETKASNCTETGTDERECSVCHEKETRTTDAKGHTNAEAVVENKVDSNCTTDGSYDSVVYCSVCKVAISREAKVIEKLGHDHETEWTVDVEATCTTVGSKSHHCSRCDDKVDITEIPANGHTWSDWYETKAPNCTETGTDERECSVCHEKETRTTDAKGHTNAEAVVENKVDSNCTTDGSYDSVVYCSVCNAELSREAKVTDKLGHDHSNEWTVDVEATCTTVGSKSHHCTRCGDKANVTEVAALGHSFTAYVSNNNATYTENGTETAKCDRCDVTDTRTDEDSALGLDQKFKDEMVALSKDANTETTYSELYSVLMTYSTLSDVEKANVATEYATLQQLIENYNTKAQAANTELADATEVAFAPIVATGFTFLAALWFLLKKKFFI